MNLLLAQANAVDPASMLPYLVIGIVVVGASAIVQLALASKQLFGGNKGERQIEPTQLAAMATELKAQTATLTKLDRESGETKKAVEALTKEVGELKTIQREDVDKLHTRVGGISRELAATTARVEDMRREARP